MNTILTWNDNGSVTTPKGFRASGVSAGIKAGRSDMAMLVSDTLASAAGLFTSNKVAAAPVRIDKAHIEASGGVIRAVVINSGCANACTGDGGLADAVETATFAASMLGIPKTQVLVSSTGVIGRRLPMDRIKSGVKLAFAALAYDGGIDASKAICTTDTVEKHAAVSFEINGKVVTIGGMCKGAGMISPRLATMLAYVTTDASVAPKDLHAALKKAAAKSFNRITVDGDESTNDTLLVFANGASGADTVAPGTEGWDAFSEALDALCLKLARKIVEDGEGATKFITIDVSGAKTAVDAYAAARAIAVSPLVKTACFGSDPNWGRIICAAGYSGAEVDDRLARISFDDVIVYDRGDIADVETNAKLAEVMKQRAFTISVNLGLGDFSDTIYTSDLSYEYVKINGEYTT